VGEMGEHTSVALVESEAARRELGDVLRLRAALLTGEDRVLLEMYLEGGKSCGRIARLRGVKTSSIWRRVRRIISRLSDPTYSLCVQEPGGLSALDLAVVKDHFVRGLSIASISRNRHLTYYRVRSTIRKARHRAAKIQAMNHRPQVETCVQNPN
jgi:DNA-directed RNA polymerase specialized sigma24 family protein